MFFWHTYCVFAQDKFQAKTMHTKLTFLLIGLLFSSVFLQAQITGSVTDKNNEPLSFVSIYFENTINGTTTNDNGLYILELTKPGTYTIVFKYLGYKSHKETITVTDLSYNLNISLTEERVLLSEVVLNATDNPANRIIRAAIANRKEHLKRLESYTADFYSKGMIKIKDAPEKILGQELGDFGGGLDSTRSGMIYLSETISKISKYKKEYKEKIIASKVSGNDNGFSFNAASDVAISYYNNTITFGNQLVSPIADNAFNYYKYQLIGTFYDDNNNLINQVKVIPKRPKDNVFKGEIYIVEDDWAIYATDLNVTGQQAQVFAVDTLFLKQSFNYSRTNKLWLKMLQSIKFKYGIFGIKGEGTFTAGYSKYDLEPNLSKKDFSNEVLSFENEANKKDSLYWNNIRPVPLTVEEHVDYIAKDSVQLIRKSQKYLDSVDVKSNKPKLGALFFGYTYNNTFKEKQFKIKSPISQLHFNTVQGWQIGSRIAYEKRNKEKGIRLAAETAIEYGFSDKRLRAHGSVSYLFNNFNRPYLRVQGGNLLAHFNPTNPIGETVNDIATLFFKHNYAKYYQKEYAEIFYSQEIFNGILLNTTLGYQQRKPAFNTTNYTTIGRDIAYTSNNPLDPSDFNDAAIKNHHLLKFSFYTRIRFGDKYLSYPDGKYNVGNNKYPQLYVGYEAGFAANNKNYNFHLLRARLRQDINIKDKGVLSYNIRAGHFINADKISFVDYKHFNGNKTHIGTGYYLDSFHLLPYYSFSTNNAYFEAHAEHNFKGYIMGKIPLLNRLNSNLVLGGNLLATANNKPYSEFSIGLSNLGWKKFRFFRLDYVQNNYGGIKESGITIGFQLLGILNN